MTSLYNARHQLVTNPQKECSAVQTCIPSGGILRKNGYFWLAGTSQAAPHVSGAIALALAKHAEWRGKPDVIEQKLRASATKLQDGACPADKPCLAGQLNAEKLLQAQ